MHPPIFETCQASSGVTALLGSGNDMRLFSAGNAPAQVAKPYAVWRTAFGSPENVLDGAPDVDTWSLDVTTYATTIKAARAIAEAMRDAIEPVAYISSWNGEDQDPETKLYTYSFSIDWIVDR